MEIESDEDIQQVMLPTESEEHPEMGIIVGVDWATIIEIMPTAEDVAQALRNRGIHGWDDLDKTGNVVSAITSVGSIVYTQLITARKRRQEESK